MSKKAYTEEERAAIRIHLIERASEVFREKGVKDTNLDEIYLPIGISKTFFYSFFPSKSSLYISVLEYNMDRIQELFRKRMSTGNDEEAVRSALLDVIGGYAFVTTIDDQKYMWNLLSDEEYWKFKNTQAMFLAEMQAMVGIPVSRLDPRVLFNLVMMIIWSDNSNESSLPFLYRESVPESIRLGTELLVDYLMSVREIPVEDVKH